MNIQPNLANIEDTTSNSVRIKADSSLADLAVSVCVCERSFCLLIGSDTAFSRSVVGAAVREEAWGSRLDLQCSACLFSYASTLLYCKRETFTLLLVTD